MIRIRAGLLPLITIVIVFLTGVGGGIWMMDAGAKTAHTEAPYMGIRFTTLEPLGVYVEDVSAGSPAALAGIQPGDVVYTLDDIYVTGESLKQMLQTYAPYENITLGIQRRGDRHRIPVVLAAQPEIDDSLQLMSLETQRDGLHLPHNIVYLPTQNVWMIGKLTPNSILYDSGLRDGDVITHINSHALTSTTRGRLVTTMLVDDMAHLTVLRAGETYQVRVSAMIARMLLMKAEMESVPDTVNE